MYVFGSVRVGMCVRIHNVLYVLVCNVYSSCVCVLYRFQANTNMEQREWIEKLQEAILNALNLAPETKEGKKGVKAAVRFY